MTRTEKAERVCELLRTDVTMSDREIARRSGASHTTVAVYRRQLESTGDIPPRPAAPPGVRQWANGNLTRTLPGQPSAALRHGLHSPLKLAPLREEGERWARARWPELDETRAKLIGDLAARVELGQRFTAEKGILRHKGRGILFPIVSELDRWERRLSDEIKMLDAEAREERKIDPAKALEEHVAEIVAARDGNGSGEGS